MSLFVTFNTLFSSAFGRGFLRWAVGLGVVRVQILNLRRRIQREVGVRAARDKSASHWRAPRGKGVKEMLAIIAAVLIVLWLLGFLAFHVSSGVIHVLLVIGIVMLLAHFFRSRTATS